MTQSEPEYQNDQILDALKRWNQEGQFSQTELAERLGITQPALSRYLSGATSKLQRETAARLVRHIPRRLLIGTNQQSTEASPRSRKPTERPKVFVSSTYLDNVEHRRLIHEAIERAEMTPIGMETWTADPRNARDLSLQHVQEADLFICILAWRYGWIPDNESSSIVELEYNEAARLGLDRYVFTLDQPKSGINIETDFDADDPFGKQIKLEAFKRRLGNEVTTRPFKKRQLQLLVMQALLGWWRGQAARPQKIPSIDAETELGEYEEVLADYWQSLEASHAHVDLPGFETKLRVPLTLEDLYVPLDLTLEDQEPAQEKRFQQSADDSVTLPEAIDLAASHRHWKGLVVLGHPGSGKTTVLRRLALLLARGGNLGTNVPSDLIPVFVPLRKLRPEDKSLQGLAQRVLEEDFPTQPTGFAKWLYTNRRLLLLVDGLDEVARDRRGKVKEWIEIDSRNPGHKHLMVVTCRHEGYLRSVQFGPGFGRLSLRPLSGKQSDTFVQRWFEAVALGLLPNNAKGRERDKAREQAKESAKALIDRLHESTTRASRVYELAHNPMLLTAICLVHRDRAKLPDRVSELYRETVDVLLQHWREAKQLPNTIEARVARRMLEPVASWLHAEEGRTYAAEEEICKALKPAFQHSDWKDLTPSGFLATIRDESGLLTGWSAERYGFMHLGFQEYLAARDLHQRALSEAGDPRGFQREIDRIAEKFGSSWWREVLSLLFAIDSSILQAHLFRSILRRDDLPAHADLLRQCVQEVRQLDDGPFLELLRLPVSEGLWPNRVVAMETLLASGTFEIEAEDFGPAQELLNQVADGIHHSREDIQAASQIVDRLAPREPQAQFTRLGIEVVGSYRGDSTPPKFVEPRSGCELILVPSGRFLMGSPDDEGHPFERPQYEVALEAFYLAIHPITNEQYARFLVANDGVKEPRFWGDRRFNQPQQPVVGVSWHDAKKFCSWTELQLPSEAQWEYACRAGSETKYWPGNSESDLSRVGWYSENSNGRLQPVAKKPASPFGLFDMHGNIREWCEDIWANDYVHSKSTHPEASSAGNRVIRGGSFRDSAGFARSAYRTLWHESDRYVTLGFRPARCITPK